MSKTPIDLPPGLTSIDTTYSSLGKWATADKVRFFQGKAQVIAGWQAISTTKITGMCRNVTAWKDNIGASIVAFGTHSDLWVWRQGRMAQITPAGLVAGNINGVAGPGYGVGAYGKGPWGQYTDLGTYYPATWAMEDYGQQLMASPRGGEIYLWSNDMTASAVLLSSTLPAGSTSYIPTTNNYVLVTYQRQLMSFGCQQQEGADGTSPGPYNPLLVRWSNADGDVTNWQASNENLAGEYTLPNGGMIVAARNWGQVIAIWTQDSMWLAEWSGDTTNVWTFTQVDSSVGLINPNACVVVGDSVFWVSPDFQVWSCVTGDVPEQFDCPILSDTLLKTKAAQSGKIIMSYSSASNELRIDYPDQRDGFENSRYLTLYLNDGTSWSQGQLARTAYDRAAMLQWPVSAAPMDENNLTTVYFQECGQTADNGNIDWSISTSDFTLDEDETTMMVRGLWPDFKNQQGTVQLTLYGRINPQDTPVAYGPFDLAPGQAKLDLRFTARIVSLEFSGSGSPASLRIGRPVFDVVPVGTR